MSERDRAPRIPGVVWPFAILALLYLVLPLVALIVNVPWDSFAAQLSSPELLSALALSLATSLASTVLCIAFGVPLALVVVRSRGIARRILRALVLVPLLLPPVVGGVALLLLLGREGLLGRLLYLGTGFSIPFTTLAVILAQTFVAMPFLILAVEGALRSTDRRLEVAAATLGADRFTIFRRVTLPLVAPGIAAGAVLCFARALGEFGATITFAGNLPGVTRTMPVSAYLAMQTDPDAALVLSLVLLAVSVAVILSLKDRWTGVAS